MSGEVTPKGGAERILDAALALFGENGFTATSLKAIAAEAGVSQALIVHHFGSKDALRRACDSHVAGRIRDGKIDTLGRAPQLDPLSVLRKIDANRSTLSYLVRALTEGGHHVDELIDQMVADAEEYIAHAVDAGVIKPSAAPRERVVTLVLWSLGSLVLHEHTRRLLGVDLLDSDPEPESLAPYMRPLLELFGQGLLEPGAFAELSDFYASSSTPADGRDK